MLQKLTFPLSLVLILFFIFFFLFFGYSGKDVIHECIHKEDGALDEVARHAVHNATGMDLINIFLLKSLVDKDSYRYEFSVGVNVFLVVVDETGCVYEIERIK